VDKRAPNVHQLLNRCLRPSVQLFLRRPLDYEKKTEYQLAVMAIDAGTQPLTGRQTVRASLLLSCLLNIFTYLCVLYTVMTDFFDNLYYQK